MGRSLEFGNKSAGAKRARRTADGLYWACAGLSASLLFQGCSGSAQRTGARQADAAPVSVATVSIQTVPIEVRAIGNVEPVTAIAVRAQVSGELSHVSFSEGDSVQKGQTLFLIDQRPYQTQVTQAQANLAKDTAQLGQAKANLARDISMEKFAREQAKRYSDLTNQGVLSKSQSDQTQSDSEVRTEAVRADQAAIESAQAAIDSDQAALERSKLELGYCTITSPLDGRTGAVTVQTGNLVTANGAQLTTINQVEPIYVTFSVPERYLTDVRKFMAGGKLAVQARLRNEASSPEVGLLVFVDNTVDASTGTIKLKASFGNTDRKLWPGQFVDVNLQLSTQPNSLVVPSQAIQTGQSGQFVFVVKSDMTVETRPVTPGIQVDQNTVVEKGLQEGEKIVTEGQLRLVPGSHVRVQGGGGGRSKDSQS